MDFVTGVWVEVVSTVGIHWCSWSCGGRYGLGKYPHLIPSFGEHGSSFVTCLGSWDFSSHGLDILGVGTGA